MNRWLLFILIYVCLQAGVSASTPPKREMRAAWLTTNWGLDWPSKPVKTSRDILKQQMELCRELDQLQALRFNTVFFQVRLRGDVIYPSAFEPWNPILTGVPGKSPGYDPLAFAVQECHRRGLACHAWMVSLPLGSDKQVRAQGKNSLVRKHPSWCKQWKGEWYLNPGETAVADYLGSLAGELVSKYDLDGIHLDYIRYPDNPQGFPDKANFKHQAAKGETLEHWREGNITRIVASVYQKAKKANPSILVSCATLGKYNSLTKYPSGGWSCKERVHQDVDGWMEQGIVDFIVPMLYYDKESFYPFLHDWVKRSGERPLVPGLGLYRLEEAPTWNNLDIQRQVALSRELGAAGQAYYRVKNLKEESALVHSLQTNYYVSWALPPTFAFLDSIAPNPVTTVQLNEQGGEKILSWNAVPDARFYTLYGGENAQIDLSDPRNILMPMLYDTVCPLPPDMALGTPYLAITAHDAYHNESLPVHIELQAHYPDSYRLYGGVRCIRIEQNQRVLKLFNSYQQLVCQAENSSELHLPKELSTGVYRLELTDETGKNQQRLVFVQE